MAVDLTLLFEPYRSQIFDDAIQLNLGVGALCGKPKEPGKNVKLGDTVEYFRRPPAKQVTRGAGINDTPTVAGGPGMSQHTVKISREQYFGDDFFHRGSGFEFLQNEEGQAAILSNVKSAVGQCALALNKAVLESVLPEVALAINKPSEELFQSVATPTGAPWQSYALYQHIADLMTFYGAPLSGRSLLLSSGQRLLAGTLPAYGNFDTGGAGAAAVRQGALPMINGITTYHQPFSLQSTTVSTPSSFGYATEATAATATIFASPDPGDLEIAIEAGGGAPLDLKAGDVLYFTTSSAELGDARRGLIQGYVVAADTAIAGGANDVVPITRAVRTNPAAPSSGADVSAGMFLRGITSHTAGLAFAAGAVELLMFPPWPLGSSPNAVQSGSGPTVGTGIVADRPMSEGGTGLTFWVRMLQFTEGFHVQVGSISGEAVVRPEHILRVVTPPVA